MAGLCPVVEPRDVFQKHGTNPGSQGVEIETGKTHQLVFFPFNDDAIESLFVRRQLPLTVGKAVGRKDVSASGSRAFSTPRHPSPFNSVPTP